MLTIRQLTKTYGNGVQALQGVDLSISRGLFGLLGPNGAGKSSLMRTLATLQEPDGGSIRLGALDVLAEPASVRRVLGYLPQDFGLYPRVDAQTLLLHFAGLKGIRGRGARQQAVRGLLEQTNLWDVRKQKLGTFSGGMRQRFGIAQALLGDPQLLIVDEPTTGLDPEERRRFLNLLARLGERAVVILSTHLVADVHELCTAMAVIDRGRVLEAGQPTSLIAQLEGRVWQKPMTAPDLARLESATEPHGPSLLSTHLIAGETMARVQSEACPGSGFVTVSPTLEDAYFSALRTKGRLG